MKPSHDTKEHYFAALLESASARMNLQAGNYAAAVKFVEQAKKYWHKVKWE